MKPKKPYRVISKCCNAKVKEDVQAPRQYGVLFICSKCKGYCNTKQSEAQNPKRKPSDKEPTDKTLLDFLDFENISPAWHRVIWHKRKMSLRESIKKTMKELTAIRAAMKAEEGK